eukprot:882485_1
MDDFIKFRLIFDAIYWFGVGYFYKSNTNVIAAQSPHTPQFALPLISNQNSDVVDSPQHILETSTIKNFQGFTRGKWIDIKPFVHPTQADIGYAWAVRKVRKDFGSATDAQKEMNPIWHEKWPYLNISDLDETSDTIPCIIGPTENNNKLLFYAIDSHHTLSALDYSQYDQTYVYLNILLDYRLLSYNEFVHQMIASQNTFLLAQKGSKTELPVPINFNQLPETFDFNKNKKTLGDSTWRSFGGYSRKVKDAPDPFPECIKNEDSEYCMRPFVRICDENGFGIPFYEFQWGYFYVDATYFNCKYWRRTDGDDAQNLFIAEYEKLLNKYYDDNGEWVDPEPSKDMEHEWRYAASLLVPLGRNIITKTYKPIDYFGNKRLPGYVRGHEKVDDDPSCQFSVVEQAHREPFVVYDEL